MTRLDEIAQRSKDGYWMAEPEFEADVHFLVAEVRSLQAENEAAHRVLSQAGVTRGGGPDGADPIIFDLPSRLHGLLEEQLEVRAEVRSLQQQIAALRQETQ